MSMLSYICFINKLIEIITESNLGCYVCNLSCPSPAFADDLSVVTIDPGAMQKLTNIIFIYSVWWRIIYNPTKCGVLVYGESEIEKAFRKPFKLGDVTLKNELIINMLEF